METPRSLPPLPLLSYSLLSVLLFFFPSSLFFRFHPLIDINPRYPAVYHAALPTIPFVEPPFPLRFQPGSTMNPIFAGNIGMEISVWRKSRIYIDGPSSPLGFIAARWRGPRWRETNLSRWFRGDLKVWERAASQANVISRATKQESAPNRRRNRFDEIKPGLGWLLYAVAMTDSIAGNNIALAVRWSSRIVEYWETLWTR